MSRLIIVPHAGGAVDYKGEDPSLFSGSRFDESGTGLVCAYSGESDSSVWPDYVDTRPSDPVEMNTLGWLRNELGTSAEMAARAYGLDSANSQCIQVQVFMEAIRDRIGDVLIVSDSDYEAGIRLIHLVGILGTDQGDPDSVSDAEAERLLTLGGFTL